MRLILFAIFSDQSRCLRDFIAGTKVIAVHRGREGRDRSLAIRRRSGGLRNLRSRTDLFEACGVLQRLLEAAGYVSWASRIADSVTTAATGTELWMGVRWNLREMDKCEEDLAEDLREAVRELIAKIDRLLG